MLMISNKQSQMEKESQQRGPQIWNENCNTIIEPQKVKIEQTKNLHKFINRNISTKCRTQQNREKAKKNTQNGNTFEQITTSLILKHTKTTNKKQTEITESNKKRSGNTTRAATNKLNKTNAVRAQIISTR